MSKSPDFSEELKRYDRFIAQADRMMLMACPENPGTAVSILLTVHMMRLDAVLNARNEYVEEDKRMTFPQYLRRIADDYDAKEIGKEEETAKPGRSEESGKSEEQKG